MSRLLYVTLSALIISTVYADTAMVDFDESMGSKDIAMKAFYDECMHELTKQHSPWFRFITPYKATDVWTICKQGYQTYLDHIRDYSDGEPKDIRIPRTIHQIWVDL